MGPSVVTGCQLKFTVTVRSADLACFISLCFVVGNRRFEFDCFYARQHVLAERVPAIVILSVCPGVCHVPVPIQAPVRETPGFHRTIAQNL